jgi:hypothetical protein
MGKRFGELPAFFQVRRDQRLPDLVFPKELIQEVDDVLDIRKALDFSAAESSSVDEFFDE